MKLTIIQLSVIAAMMIGMLPAHINPSSASVSAEESIISRPTDTNQLYPLSESDLRRRSDGTSSIPTTSNPTGNGVQGLRTYANTSFEDSGFACFSLPQGWAYINQTKMRGWLTAHPEYTESNCAPSDGGPGNDSNARVIEVQRNGVSNGNTAFHGTKFAELNAHVKTFIYQQICVSNSDVIAFTFRHKALDGSRFDIMEFSFGIPSGLPSLSGKTSLSGDSYYRPIMYAKTTTDAGKNTSAVAHTGFSYNSVNYTTPSGTTGATSSDVGFWGQYSGTHTLPASGWSGVRNLGFAAILGSSDTGGNILDGIEVGLSPIIDFGTSRDTGGNETSAPPSINIRINGRVAANTKIMLQMAEGTSIPDTDFALGTVSAGTNGTATVVHTSGSNNWLITVPAGDYDGGVVPANNIGGLTIPVTYTSDSDLEPTEYMYFKLLFPGKIGSSTNWVLGDPTCDGSRKIDGVVYSIVDVGPTSTPVPTNTMTPSRTPSPTHTLTPTNTNTLTPTRTFTLTPSNTLTPSPTFTTSPTFTITPTFTRTNTLTPSPRPFALRDVAVGALFTVGVLNNGSMVTWGFNREGQASIPSWMRGVPVREVEVGSNWVVALKTNGEVVGWGQNDFGQLNIPTAAKFGVKSISAYFGHVIALKQDGSIVTWGRNNEQQATPPRGLRDLKDVSAGHAHSLAVTSDETVIGWGNQFAVQPNFIATLGGIKAVSAGFDHSLALTNWGRIICWRSTSPNPAVTQDVGQCDPYYQTLYDIVAISAGKQYSLALDKNGKVYAWGLNNFGQANVPNLNSRATVIEAGYLNSVIGYQDTSVRAFGDSKHGALVSRTPTRARSVRQTVATPTP